MLKSKHSPIDHRAGKESGNGPSLGCAEQEEDDNPKGERESFGLLCSLLSLVIFVLQSKAKGKKRKALALSKTGMHISFLLWGDHFPPAQRSQAGTISTFFSCSMIDW